MFQHFVRAANFPLFVFVIAAAWLAVGYASPAIADVHIWTGAGSTANWSESANWDIGVPESGDSLQFGNISKRYITNNLPDGLILDDITYASDASNYTFYGNPIVLSGDINDNTTWQQYFAVTVTLSPGNHTVNVASGQVDLNILNGTGGITKTGGAKLRIRGNAAYTGDTTISAGTLNIESGYFAGNVLNNGSFVMAPGTCRANISGTGSLVGSGGDSREIRSVLTLDGYNTYTGTTSVSQGAIRLTTPNALPGGIGVTGGLSHLVIGGYGIIELAVDNFFRGLGTGPNQVELKPNSGFSAYGGDRVVNLGGASAKVTWNQGYFVPDGYGLYLSTTQANATVDFQNPIDLNGANRFVYVSDGAAAVDGKLSGSISGTGGLAKNGFGGLELTSENTYTGTTYLNEGLLRLSHPQAIPGGTGAVGGTGNMVIASHAILELATGNFLRPLGTGPGQVQINGGGFGAYGADRIVNFGGNSAQVKWGQPGFLQDTNAFFELGSSTANALVDFQNPLDLGTYDGNTHTIGIRNGSAAMDARLSRVISGNNLLAISGNGALEFTAANTFTGGIVLSGGILRLSNPQALPGGTGVTGGLDHLNLNYGAGSIIELASTDFFCGLGNGAGQIRINGSGGFSAYGANRIVNLGGQSEQVSWVQSYFINSSSGWFVLSSPIANAMVDFQNPIDFAGDVRTVLVNNGSAIIDARLSGTLSGAGGGLKKTGDGTLELTANSSYTGSTIISAGTLLVNGSIAAASPVTVQQGSTLGGGGSVGAVTVESGGRIAPGDLLGSVGTMTINGELLLNPGAILDFDLAALGASDLIAMPASTLTLTGQQFSDFSFTAQNGFGPGTYTLVAASLIQGSLDCNACGIIDGFNASISINGRNLVLTVVPEPSIFLLLTIGAIGCLGYVWHRLKHGISLMKRVSTMLFSLAVLGVFFYEGLSSEAHGALVSITTGNVVPIDPSSWNNSTTAYIGNTSTGTLTVTSGTLISRVAYIGYGANSTGTVTIDSAASDWSNREFFVGESGRGTLNITNGATAGDSGGCYGFIGDKSGSTGIVNVDGNGSTWGRFRNLSVGTAGNGTMNISNGGYVNSGGSLIGDQAGSTGTVMVDGVGSNWVNEANSYDATYGDLYVGSSGNGTFIISNGGTATSGGTWGDAVGRNAGSLGVVRITGAGSKWTSVEDLYVGSSGNGSVIVSNGGAVITGISGAGTAGGACIGYQTGSTGSVVVDGINSTWKSNYNFSVGFHGNGTLTISNGGKVTAGPYIGYHPGSSGTVNVDGSGSTWMPYALYIGYYGAGTLNISNGGSVAVDDTTYLAYRSGSTGSVNFGPGGGTLTTKMLWAKLTSLTGTGTIVTKGLVTDADLVYDSTHGADHSFIINRSGQNITVNLDLSNASTVSDLGVGYAEHGSLTVRDGVTINSQFGYLAYQPGSAATATVDGANSNWNLNSVLFVGYRGSGTLRITNGGSVGSSLAAGEIAYSSGSSGTVIVDGANSVWNIPYGYNNVFAIGGSGNGTLQISNGGVVNSLRAYGEIAAGSGSTGKVTVDGVGSAWNSSNAAYVAYYGNATLDITNGAVVNSSSGIIGNSVGSLGVATVDGPGSKWNANGGMNVGSQGNGMLRITNGGIVASTSTNSASSIAKFANATGIVGVDGIGSLWSAGKTLTLGASGRATLNISGGGTVMAESLTATNKSLIAIDVGRDSTLVIGGGSGTISNSGTIRILAGASVPPGACFAPVSAGNWTGTDTYQALGGTWDAVGRQFTVSTVQIGASGTAVSIDLAVNQRILVSDSLTDKSIGASFLAKTTSTPVSFTATPVSDGSLNLLNTAVNGSQSTLGGWLFATSGGYVTGDPAYVSFAIGSNHSTSDLTLWRFDGSSWSRFAVNDLTYDGNYVSFTATDLNGFAVTAIPEPSIFTLFGMAALGFLGYAKRLRRHHIN
jgi:T5SS/PEP-CTERM-associated repeat protein/autotransporter-associated beta strand protein